MSRLAAAAFAVAILLPAAASAEQPASIGGLVYDCASGRPVAGASLTLRGLDDGTVVHLRADANGRFAKAGLTPGRWQIQAAIGEISSSTREAVLETDDALAMRIGISTIVNLQHMDGRGFPTAPAIARAACNPYRIPAAASTSDRYIIH